MKRFAIKLSLAAVPVFFFALAGSASAQASRTWVSGVGDDANPCSRTAPCKTFAGAISKTAAGGEISVLDPGGFGAVTITKSISIYCEYSGEGGILSAGTNAININAAATDVINLRGLAIEGSGTGLTGVNILSAGQVHLQDMLIRNIRGTTNSAGVSVTPGANPVKVTIVNTTIANTGSVSGGAGVYVRPTGSASASVAIQNSQIVGNTVGVKADGSGGTGAINVQVSNSLSSSNVGQGVFAQSNPGATVSMFVTDSVVANNGSPGLRVQGANATATISGSTFTGNGGPGIQSQNGGVLNSYRNNQSLLNGAADSATTPITPS
jgi:hypothetical protein